VQSEEKGTIGKFSIATIRHFYVEEKYRTTGIQQDLLRRALEHAFTSDQCFAAVQITVVEPWEKYIATCAQQSNFASVGRVQTRRIGLHECRTYTLTLSKEVWESN
jgi:GNAT superfamily N-acetyltransferase